MTSPRSLLGRFDRPWQADLAVFLLYTIVCVVFTWPIATDVAELAPAHFDPPFTAWRLGWIAHELARPGSVVDGRFFDGNIYWPERHTLAYSDAVLLQGALGTPLAMLGVGPNAIANVLILIGIVTSAFFAYLLAARLSGSRRAAIVAGLVFAFSTYRRVHLQHLELQWAQWMPLAFYAWHKLLDTGRMRDGLLCAVAVLLQLLSSIYYTIFLAIGLAIVGTVTLIARRGRIGVPAVIGLVGGAVIAAGVAATYASPYNEVRQKVGDRSLGETHRYSATPTSFITASPDSVLYRHILPTQGEGETELFTGFTPVALAGAALIPPTAATAVAYGLTLVVAGDMALGTNGFSFTALRGHVRALKALRAPGRLGILVQLALGVLASLGLARLIRRWPRVGSTIAAASIALVLVEYANGPLQTQRLPASPSQLQQWLAVQPKLVTLELPAPLAHALPLHDPLYMYMSTWHWQPLVNGYSGHYAPRYIDLLRSLPTLPSRESTRAMTAAGVQRVILHQGLFEPDTYIPLVSKLEGDPNFHLEAVAADHWGEARVYAFVPGFGPRERR